MVLRVDRHAAQVRADVASLAAVGVARGAVLLEKLFAASGVARLLRRHHQFVDNLLPVGAWKAPAALKHGLRPVGNATVRVIVKRLFLIETKLAERDLALVDR